MRQLEGGRGLSVPCKVQQPPTLLSGATKTALSYKLRKKFPSQCKENCTRSHGQFVDLLQLCHVTPDSDNISGLATACYIFLLTLEKTNS